MVRTATLDLNSRGSFVDDLNSKPGIVMCRDALLHRSHEIQPAFFDSEIFFPLFSLRRVDVGRGTCAARGAVGRAQWRGSVCHVRLVVRSGAKKYLRHHLGSNQGPVG